MPQPIFKIVFYVAFIFVFFLYLGFISFGLNVITDNNTDRAMFGIAQGFGNII